MCNQSPTILIILPTSYGPSSSCSAFITQCWTNVLLPSNRPIWLGPMLWKCCTQCASKFGKLSSGHSFHSNPKERQTQRMLKLSHNCTHLTPSKIMLKILQAKLQQYMNRELPDVQAGFRKGRGTRDQIANICWIIKKAREFQKKKHLFLLYWLCQSLWLCGSQ